MRLYAKVTILSCDVLVPPTVLLGPPSAYSDQPDHNFGAAVSVGERFALVGAPGADAAFVFQVVPLNTEAVATLEAPDKTTGDSFGHAVSLGAGGGWIAVGAPNRDEGGSANKGAVYVFQQDAAGVWSYHSKITSTLAGANDHFGFSVSVDEVPGSHVRVLVGCDYHLSYSGFVEVFELGATGAWTMAWSHTIGGHGAKYGSSVSLSGDFLAVGSWSDNFEYKTDQGTIFCYTRNADGSWSDRGKTGGGAWGRSNSNLKVGWSVSQDGGYQVAGAPGDSSNRGAAYVRQRVQEDLNGDGDTSDSGEAVTHAKGFVVEADTGAGDLFGTSVALKWPYLLVGAPSHGTGGASFLYEFNTTWHKVQKFESPSMQAVGTSVSLSDGLALTGAAGRAILNFRSAPLSATVTCGGSCGDGCAPTSGAISGTFSDGSGNYGNNENCWWLIEAPGAEISVSFSSFDTESCCDHVSIYRCATAECASSPRILRHAGSQVPNPYMHTHTHSCMQILSQTCIHTHTRTHTNTQTRKHTNTHTRARACSRASTCACARMYLRMRACMLSC